MLSITLLLSVAALVAAQDQTKSCDDRVAAVTTQCEMRCAKAPEARQEQCKTQCGTAAATLKDRCEKVAAAAAEGKAKFDAARDKIEEKAEEARAQLEASIEDGSFKATCVDKICSKIDDAAKKTECTDKCNSIETKEEAQAVFRAAAEKVTTAARAKFEEARGQTAEKREAARAKLQEAIVARRGALEEKKAVLATKFDEIKAKAAEAAEGRREEVAAMKSLIEQFKAAETDEAKAEIKAQIQAQLAANKEARGEIREAMAGKKGELVKKVLAGNPERRESLKLIIAEFKGKAAERKAEIMAKLKEMAPSAEVDSEDGRRRATTVVAVVPCNDELCVLEANTVFAEVAEAESDVAISEINAQEVDSEAQEAQIGEILGEQATAPAKAPAKASGDKQPAASNAPSMDDVDSATTIAFSAVAILASFFAL